MPLAWEVVVDLEHRILALFLFLYQLVLNLVHVFSPAVAAVSQLCVSVGAGAVCWCWYWCWWRPLGERCCRGSTKRRIHGLHHSMHDTTNVFLKEKHYTRAVCQSPRIKKRNKHYCCMAPAGVPTYAARYTLVSRGDGEQHTQTHTHRLPAVSGIPFREAAAKICPIWPFNMDTPLMIQH